MTRLRTLTSIRDLAADDWDRLANPSGGEFNPLVSHAFLAALEVSGSAIRETGWLGQHLLLEADDELLGAAPCYLKSHSYGEYVFDHSWADAYQRAGGRYYPKLQVAIPFTPVTGPRLLAKTPELKGILLSGLEALCRNRHVSSVHITFLPAEDARGENWVHRTDIQFHWYNHSFANFQEFLDTLSSRKRKNIRKEREEVRARGITHEWLTGTDIREHHWDAFFEFYQDTGSRKWGSTYLTRPFFSLIGETMAKNILLVMARRSGRYIAGALNFIGSKALFGRNWGAIETHPCLHFETCYYQAIEFAIARGLKRVEAGAQGPHKLARGYEPILTHSLHYLDDPRLRRAVGDYLEGERTGVNHDRDILARHAPFRSAVREVDY